MPHFSTPLYADDPHAGAFIPREAPTSQPDSLDWLFDEERRALPVPPNAHILAWQDHIWEQQRKRDALAHCHQRGYCTGYCNH